MAWEQLRLACRPRAPQVDARAVAAVALALTMMPSGALAQAQQDQPLVSSAPGAVSGLFGGRGPADPTRPGHRLRLTADLGVGYDDDVEGVEFGLPGGSAVSGRAGNGSVGLRYRFGRTGRGVEFQGTAYGARFAERTLWPIGSATFLGETNIGTTSGVSATVTSAYEPTFLFFSTPASTAAPIAPDTSTPAAQGVARQRWLANSIGGRAFHDWAPRQRTDVSFETVRRQPLDESAFDNRSQLAQVRHSWNLNNALAWTTGYAFQANRQTTPETALPPVRTNSLTTGFALNRRLSPTRRLDASLMGGFGRTQLREFGTGASSVSVEPTFVGSLRTNLVRSWVVSVDGGRTVTALEGVAPRPFATSSLSMRIDGAPTRRIRVNAAGSLASGSTIDSTEGAFESATASLRLQYGITPMLGLFASLSYYEHRLTGVNPAIVGFPAANDRRSARIGLTLWMPLYGSY